MVAALQKEQILGDGTCYTRPAHIEAALEVLCELPLGDLVERARITNRSDPLYVPSECLLHVFRDAGRQKTLSPELEQLFLILRRRVLSALPAVLCYAPGDKQPSESASASEIQEAVLFRFQQLLCEDRLNYQSKLDFFEVRFDQAIARLRLTARKKVKRQEDRSEPLLSEEAAELSPEVVSALVRLQRAPGRNFEETHYRRHLLAAIDTLPEKERRVIQLMLQNIPIESQDPDTITIAGILGCSEKTVRNRRDRALNMLRPLFGVTVGND